MANPKRRHSNARTAKRRAHWKLSSPKLKLCPQCKTPILLHRICPNCGYYKGRKLIELKEK